jgi:hypothetical protein
MADQPPTFAQLMDRAILSNDQVIDLAVTYSYDPILAGVKIGSIIAGQQMACRLAVGDDAPEARIDD